MMCYDIFNLADFPIIITDRKFIIQYKNSIAKSFFSGFRKRSKITLYTDKLDKDSDLSEPLEIEFSQGTQYKRALVFLYEENTVLFIFLSNLQFEISHTILERVKENFGGNFLDFYISACNTYAKSQNAFENSIPPRLLEDLMLLMKISRNKLSFLNKEVCNIYETLENICRRIGNSFSALGFKMSALTALDDAHSLCFCKINSEDFLFVLFTMIYTSFKFSGDGYIVPKLEYSLDDHVIFRISTKACSKLRQNEKDALHILSDLSELSLEVGILKKLYEFERTVFCYVKDGILNIEFKFKCVNGCEALTLRSDLAKLRKRALNRAISANISRLKKLLANSI